MGEVEEERDGAPIAAAGDALESAFDRGRSASAAARLGATPECAAGLRRGLWGGWKY